MPHPPASAAPPCPTLPAWWPAGGRRCLPAARAACGRWGSTASKGHRRANYAARGAAVLAETLHWCRCSRRGRGGNHRVVININSSIAANSIPMVQAPARQRGRSPHVPQGLELLAQLALALGHQQRFVQVEHQRQAHAEQQLQGGKGESRGIGERVAFAAAAPAAPTDHNRRVNARGSSQHGLPRPALDNSPAYAPGAQSRRPPAGPQTRQRWAAAGRWSPHAPAAAAA